MPAVFKTPIYIKEALLGGGNLPDSGNFTPCVFVYGKLCIKSKNP